MSITGNLRTLELSELLQWLAQGKKTGTLVVEQQDLEKRIYFSRWAHHLFLLERP
ncbi:MAG: DUF4388 domain-containing protein [Thermoanaerobaculia bacterium]